MALLLFPGLSLAIALGSSCDVEVARTGPARVTTGAGSTGGGATTSTTAGAGGLNCKPFSVEGKYTPAGACWRAVAWPNDCYVEVAHYPEIAAPPLDWVACDGLEGCTQQFEQPVLYTHGQASKASVVPWDDGYRVGIREAFIAGGKIAAVYDETGKPIAAWRTHWNHCEMVRPIVTPERVWLGVTKIGGDPATASTYIAARWDELMTVSETVQLDRYYQAWWASSEVALGWVANGISFQVEDLASGSTALFGGPWKGNPDYAYPHVVGSSVVALTAPDGYPDVTVWDRSTQWFSTIVNPDPPWRVADANSDGTTLVWVEKPDSDAPGELWTSPMTATPEGLEAAYRRPTPPVMGSNSAAFGGYYAVFSVKKFGSDGPGDGRIHVYRLADAHHWAFDIPAATKYAIWIYHVDEHYVFYSGYGSLVRQQLDVLGPGDPAP